MTSHCHTSQPVLNICPVSICRVQVRVQVSGTETAVVSCPEFVAQSRVGPVEWLKPYTDATIEELGKSGVKSLLAVPIRYTHRLVDRWQRCGWDRWHKVLMWQDVDVTSG